MSGNIRFLPIEKVLLRDSLGGVMGSFPSGHFSCSFPAKTSTGLKTSGTQTLNYEVLNTMLRVEVLG